MVGELSPDGQSMWDGTQWVPATPPVADVNPMQQMVTQPMQPTAAQPMAQPLGYDTSMGHLPPFPDAAGGKATAKLLVVGTIASLLLAGVGYASYEFVIDPMLDPDPYDEKQFISAVKKSSTQEEVLSGQVDDWNCKVDLKMEISDELFGEMKIKMKSTLSATPDTAFYDLDMTVISGGFPIPVNMEVWMSEDEFAMKSMDGSSVSEFDSIGVKPADAIFTDADSMASEAIPFCFFHHEVGNDLEQGGELEFSSVAERFPDEDGVRAVKVSLTTEFDDQDIDVSWFFDEDDRLIGGKASNESGLELLMEFSDDDVERPSWVSKADIGPMPIGFASGVWDNSTHRNVSVIPQFSSTQLMDDVDILLFEEKYDYDLEEDVTIIHLTASLDEALAAEGVTASFEYEGEVVNCTFIYRDANRTGIIDKDDRIEMECDTDEYLSGLDLGLVRDDVVAKEVSLELPWLNPFISILGILGAALVMVRSDRHSRGTRFR